jgi:serine/threonine protein kinase
MLNPCVPNSFCYQHSPEVIRAYRINVLYHFTQLERLDNLDVGAEERQQVVTMKEKSLPPPSLPSISSINDADNSHILFSAYNRETIGFTIIKDGYLTVVRKELKRGQKWDPCWVLLGENKFIYFRDKRHFKPEGVISLRDYKVDIISDPSLLSHINIDTFALFCLTHEERRKPTYYLIAQTKESMDDWIFYLKDQIKVATLIKSPTESEKLRALVAVHEEERQQWLKEEKEKHERRFKEITKHTHQIAPQEIKLVRVLGHGSFGTVYHGIVRGKDVAIKILHNRDVEDEILDNFCNEVEIISQFHHPQIMLFMGASTQPGALMIVMELMKCSLECLLLNKSRKLNLMTKLRIAKDAALGMAWLHGADPMIVHRDVKPSNFLVDENLRVVVSDFGLSEMLRQGHSTFDDYGWKGTPHYLAPEVIRGIQWNEKSDVYSFGIVLWCIYTREPVYEELAGQGNKFADLIVWQKYRPKIPEDCPHSYAQLMQDCWDEDPNVRPSFEQILIRLDEIIIEQAIRDPKGREFWSKNFPNKDRVQWNQFFAEFKQYLPSDLDSSSLKILKAFLAQSFNAPGLSKNDEYVLIETFGNVLDWFGPLNKANDMVARMKSLVSKRWFHGDTTARESTIKLAEQPPGTFLVRFSRSQLGSFTVAYVTKKHHIVDRHIFRTVTLNRVDDKEVVLEEYTIQWRNGPKKYESLQTLINDQPFLILPCPGSPYAPLYLNITLTKSNEDLESESEMEKSADLSIKNLSAQSFSKQEPIYQIPDYEGSRSLLADLNSPLTSPRT